MEQFQFKLDEDIANKVEAIDFDRQGLQDTLLRATEMRLNESNATIFQNWENRFIEKNREFSIIKNLITEQYVKPAIPAELKGYDFTWNLNYGDGVVTVTFKK